MEKEKDVQRKIFEVRMLEEQIRQLESQVALIDKEILELQTVQANLDEIKKIKQKDVLVHLGKNIFINSRIESGDSVLVDVGAKTVIKKDIDGAKNILEKQKYKFIDARNRINSEVDRIIEQIDKVDREILGLQK